MPPKTRRNAVKTSAKSSETGPKKPKKSTVNADRAKQRNQAFLREALNASLAGSGNEFSDTEHMFVSVKQAHSSRGFGKLIKTDSLDPLDLSQGAILEPESELDEQIPESIATTSLLQTKSLEPSTTESKPDPRTKSDPPSLSPIPSPVTLPPELGTAAHVEKTDDGKLEDSMSEDGKSDDGKSDDGKSADGKSDDSKSNDGKFDDGKSGDGNNDISDSHASGQEDMHKKFAALLLKYEKKTDKLKLLQKNHSILKRKYAEVKDTLVYTVAEAKKDRMNLNSSTPFTDDPDIDMPVERIQQINNMSKSVGNFAQNLAISMYGASNLRNRSVTGKECNRMKGKVLAKPGISPKKLKFIYAKARQRVELEVGSRNSEQVELLADKTIVNRALAEKIANLRKATTNAAENLQPADADNGHC